MYLALIISSDHPLPKLSAQAELKVRQGTNYWRMLSTGVIIFLDEVGGA
jgi:hypothetical protein